MLERDVDPGMRAPGRNKGSVALAFFLLGALTACEAADLPFGGYPALNTVPEDPRPSTPIEERRQIVRDLIDERDRTRTRTAIVRDRSGLGVDAFPDVAGETVRAEDIILDSRGQTSDPFRLTPGGEKNPADSVYRTESEVEDGGLDDFIRQLKSDTNPNAPQNSAKPIEFDEDETSFFVPGEPGPADPLTGETSSIRLAAFAPVVRRGPPVEGDLMVRLAAAEDEPGFFCGRFGWLVAWSNMCVAEDPARSEQEGDQDVVADVEPGTEGSAGEADAERSTRMRSQSSDEVREERTERRLSEEDASEALEEAGRNVLGPIASSLDKLRDFIRERRSAGTTSESVETLSPSSPLSSESVDRLRPASQSPSAEVVDPPLIPRSRPERRENVTIVDQGETFDFRRTPTPAFKPLYEDQARVILSPEQPRQPARSTIERSEPPPRPSLRPSDLLPPGRDNVVSLRAEEAGEALPDDTVAFVVPSDASLLRAPATRSPERTTETAPDTSKVESEPLAKLPTPAIESLDAAALATDDTAPETSPPRESEPVFIRFTPEVQGVPDDESARLATLLAKANSEGQKIYIVGEAGTNHLARRRATDVGAALVQLGATVEVLEYDHEVKGDVDQVRLQLRPADQDSRLAPAVPTMIEK